ncbi:MAG: biotin--[acetyl-CoA-carboxylase] ligase [Gaiellales bacterium]
MDAEDPQRGRGRNVITRATCPSTQDVVREEGLAGAPAGTVCVTDHQTAGRGRRGRTWSDPPGTAVMFSYLARPTLAPAALGPLPLVVGVALADALPLEVGLRWPNDLVLGAGKVGGILVELVTPPAGPPFAVIGVGINANLTATQLPPTDRLPATSLLVEGGAPVDRVALLERLVVALDDALAGFAADGFAPFRARFDRRDRLRGCTLELRLGDRVVSGVAGGVDDEGRLLIGDTAYAAGEVERVID